MVLITESKKYGIVFCHMVRVESNSFIFTIHINWCRSSLGTHLPQLTRLFVWNSILWKTLNFRIRHIRCDLIKLTMIQIIHGHYIDKWPIKVRYKLDSIHMVFICRFHGLLVNLLFGIGQNFFLCWISVLIKYFHTFWPYFLLVNGLVLHIK